MVNCKMDKYIVVFSRHVDNWGAERSTCSLCRGLKDKGYNVLAVIPRSGAIISLFEQNQIDYIIHEFSGWLYEGSKRPSFKHLCKVRVKKWLGLHSLKYRLGKMNIKPILVYSNTLTFDFGIRFAKLYDIPHVQHIRENIDAFDYHFTWGYEKSMKLINTSYAIMCTCDTIRKRYLLSLDNNKFFTVYNGVPPVRNVPQKVFEQKRLEIIQVARFMDDKRVVDSLMAMKILKEKGIDNVHLDIYGKGEEENEYLKYIEENDLSKFIEIKGFVQEIDFQPYHLGLMTSTFEAFSRSVLDYMNNGLAVIASRAGGNTEQVVDGKTGILYEVKNPRDLANAIITLNSNREKLEELAMNARERYLENFTQDRYVARTNEIIIKALNNEQL